MYICNSEHSKSNMTCILSTTNSKIEINCLEVTRYIIFRITKGHNSEIKI